MQAKVQYVSFPAGRRIIAISDIHGNLDLFLKLLEKIHYTKEDILVIVGDMIEKGAQSLAVLRHVMHLSLEGTVYSLAGNHDFLYQMLLEAEEPETRQWLLTYLMREDRRNNLFWQMADEMGFPLSPAMDFDALRHQLPIHFPEETDFLLNLPDILESDNIRFVHAGLTSNLLSEQDAFQCRKFDDFMAQEIAMDKFCIVGHWPVCNYERKRGELPGYAPYYDAELNICGIDGGCEVKRFGQLNAFILPEGNPALMEFAACDDFPLITALDAQEAASPYFLNWGYDRHWVEIVKETEDLYQVRQLLTGRLFWTTKRSLYTSGGRLACASATNYEHKIRPGEQLSLLDKTSRGALVRKDGIIGWYYGRYEPLTI